MDGRLFPRWKTGANCISNFLRISMPACHLVTRLRKLVTLSTATLCRMLRGLRRLKVCSCKITRVLYPSPQGRQTGIATPEAASLASASLLSPVAWPYMTTTGQQNAYQWISRQLCCDSIRSTYTNLNIDPTVWLGLINQISFNADAAETNNFSQDDFNDEMEQLPKEFAYVALVRDLQNNILSLFQDQQSNVSLLITQAGSDILADVATDSPQPIQPSPWSTFTNDVFPVLSNFAGFAGTGERSLITR